MKLRTYDAKGEVKFIEVGFWSFLKCNLLVQLAMLGLFYAAVIVMVVAFMIAFPSWPVY